MTVLTAVARSAARVGVATAAGTPTPNPIRDLLEEKRRWGRYLGAGMFAAVVLIGGIAGGGAPANPTCAASGMTVFDGDLARILATIRHLESRGDYTARARHATASGAYQFIDATWGGYGGYSSAYLAPPQVQDAKAAEWVTTILAGNGNDVAAVPVAWYIGHVPPADSAEWDTVPYPDAGNVFTPRQYQTKWMAIYNNAAGPASGTPLASVAEGEAAGPTCIGAVGAGNYAIPTGTTRVVGSAISWGGYENGLIPLGAMRYSDRSGHMHPGASIAWDELHAAALTEGFDLSGWSYRPRDAGGETAGTSNHGWGLAIDVDVLVPGNTYPTTDAAFASPEYQWLAANAATFGYINPDWARPTSLGGTGAGGWVGDSCCHLEPWHWEWAAFMSQPAQPPEEP